MSNISKEFQYYDEVMNTQCLNFSGLTVTETMYVDIEPGDEGIGIELDDEIGMWALSSISGIKDICDLVEDDSKGNGYGLSTNVTPESLIHTDAAPKRSAEVSNSEAVNRKCEDGVAASKWVVDPVSVRSSKCPKLESVLNERKCVEGSMKPNVKHGVKEIKSGGTDSKVGVKVKERECV